jgi:putative lipase involved disintegration of autophagic bodies
MTRKMADDSTDNSADVNGQIAYHEEMESLAYRAGDYTKAEHHRKMKEICKAMKEKQQPYKTPEQLSDEDYKVAPTSADKEKMRE